MCKEPQYLLLSLAFTTVSLTLFLEDGSPKNVHRCTAATATVQNIVVPIRVMDTIVVTNCAYTV
jgi:aromatic ring-opening dioxygenase catalytic subunit (LigB family)